MSIVKNPDIVILGGARDYHVIDWYRTIKRISPDRKIVILTDTISSEGYKCIIDRTDNIQKLFIIDKFLFKKQSVVGNIWRNIIKLLFIPIQIIYLKKYFKENPDSIFHAQPMYYMFLCNLSKIKFVGTPQGDEILIRPYKSKLYRYFAINTLKSAYKVSVDSLNMKNEIYKMSNVNSYIIRKGIDVDALTKFKNTDRTKVISIRAITPLYRIKEIIEYRKLYNNDIGLTFIYPFIEEKYYREVCNSLNNKDINLGRLDKGEMYELLSQTFLTISIPKSDSSPRSVYEAIFAGSCVAIEYNEYVDVLPECMKTRIYIVDLNNKKWFAEAVEFAKNKSREIFSPSDEAIKMFDQNYSLNDAIDKLYV